MCHAGIGRLVIKEAIGLRQDAFDIGAHHDGGSGLDGFGTLGVIAGSMMAILGMRGMMLSPTSRGFIDPDLPLAAFAIAAAMGALLCLFGGLYPAIRASRLEPTEALRHD